MISGRVEGFLISFQSLVYIYPMVQGMSSAGGVFACFLLYYNELAE